MFKNREIGLNLAYLSEFLAVAVESLTNAFFLLWLESPERHPYPDNPDTIFDILFKGLIAV